MSTAAMKQLVALVFAICLTLAAAGQRVDASQLEVKDSTGRIIPPEEWERMVYGGRYTLRLEKDMKTALLVKLTEEEFLRRLLKAPRPRESNFFTTGQQIPAFAEKDINGTKFDLKTLAGKVVVLNFWFINCGPCRMEMPELNELVDSFRTNKDVVFLAVALDTRYAIQEFLKTTPFAYNIIDNGRFIAGRYGIDSYPTHAVIDRHGKVLFHTSGYTMNTVAWVKRAVQAALENKPLE